MIAIVIPTIGRVATFEESFASAIRSDRSIVSEIVVVDNSQNAEYASQLQALPGRDSRVTVVRYAERKSMAQSWNHALASVRSNWILYLHDDDILRSENLPRLLPLLSAGEPGLICCDFTVLYQERKRIERKFPPGTCRGEAAARLFLRETPKFVSTVIHRKALEEAGLWDDRAGYFLDVCAFLKIAQARDIVFAGFDLGTYRIHGDNLSSAARRNSGYGDHLGHVIGELFKLYPSQEMRREIVDQFSRFAFPPPQGRAHRVVRGILVRLGLRS